MDVERKVDALLQTRFGKNAITKMQKSAAKETQDEREKLVGEIERIDADHAAFVAEHGPKLKEAERVKKEAFAKMDKTANTYGFLRRRLSSASYRHDREITTVERRLRETADPSIDVFIADCREAEAHFLSREIVTQKKPTGAFGEWGERFNILSTRQSAEEKAATVRAIRLEAETLRFVADATKALAELRGKLPSDALAFTETGQEVEAMV